MELRRARLRALALCLAVAALPFTAGCASLTEIEQTQFAQNFPPGPGRTYYLKKSLFGTTILVCDGGPRDAVCFEKPN